MATAIVLKYYNAGWVSRSYSALSVRGLTDPDDCQIVGVQHDYRSGGVEEEILGFHRVLIVDFGVLQDADDREHILNFLTHDQRQITTSSDYANVALFEPERFQNEWLDDVRLRKRFILRLIDSYVYTIWPVQAVTDTLVYIKNRVKIEGTQASPETFTTNSGKLATDETGAVYPTFNSSTHVFHVSINGAPYQDGKINLIATPSVSAGNITFQAAVSDGGNPSSDGFFYADVAIFLQTI